MNTETQEVVTKNITNEEYLSLLGLTNNGSLSDIVETEEDTEE